MRMKKRLLMIAGIILSAVLTISVNANEMLWDGFKSGEIVNYIGNGAKNVGIEKAGNGNFVLKIPLEKKKRVGVTTLVTPVEAGARYKFSFKCKVNGPYTFEKKPQLEYLLLMKRKERKEIGQTDPLPTWNIFFHDGSGKGVSRRLSQFFTCMLYSGNKKYTEEFVVPYGSKTMTISFNNGNIDTSLVISDLKLEKIDNPESLNINGDFSLGRHNYSGWNDNYKFSCKLRKNPEKTGTFQYDAHKGISYGDSIYVEPGKKYNISYRFHSVAGNKTARLRVYFYPKDRKTKLLRPFVRISSVSKGKSIEGSKPFVPPPNTGKMKIYFNGGIYDYVKITEFSETQSNSTPKSKGN